MPSGGHPPHHGRAWPGHPSWSGAASDGRDKPHTHQDYGGLGEKSSASPRGRGLGEGGATMLTLVRRSRLRPVMESPLPQPPPPNHLPQGEGEYFTPASAYPDADGDNLGHDGVHSGNGTMPTLKSMVCHQRCGQKPPRKASPSRAVIGISAKVARTFPFTARRRILRDRAAEEYRMSSER
jgi:hypothetical protein